ncbi:unnamed protein product [Amoebophrya sp. A120]|nr:unnamed protein product [Amoebophrya sp. A120]|eukprot:GSA120T00008090001.1
MLTGARGVVIGEQPQKPPYSSNFVIPCARKILDYVNKIRIEKGLLPLNTHKGLCRAAETHAARMSEALVPFSHQNALSRINDAGTFEGCGENLARLENYGLEAVPEAAVDGWVHSPGHFRNMVMPDFNVCGIGLATYYKNPDNRHLAAQEASGGELPYLAHATGQCPQLEEPRESVTFVTMLFGIERVQKENAKTKVMEKTDATICACGLVGAAIGGILTGGMLGVAAGSFLHKAVGITPKGTAFCIKEFTKRSVLGLGKLKCSFCENENAKYELDDALFCADCWSVPPDGVGFTAEQRDESAFVVL